MLVLGLLVLVPLGQRPGNVGIRCEERRAAAYQEPDYKQDKAGSSAVVSVIARDQACVTELGWLR